MVDMPTFTWHNPRTEPLLEDPVDVRRVLGASAAALALSLATAGSVGAQESPPTSDVSPTSEVQGPAPRGEALPTTGSDIGGLVLLGAASAGVGAAAVVASRRRRASAAVSA